MALTDTPWCGNQGDRLYLQSGRFTSTLKTSFAAGGIDTAVSGISWDGTNTPWMGRQADKMYLQSGQFSSTVLTSQSAPDVNPYGISYDGNDTPWCGNSTQRLYVAAGQFSSSQIQSVLVSGIDTFPTGISWDGTNTPWIGDSANKLYLQSGQITTTLKTSQSISGVDSTPQGIAADGTDTLWNGTQAQKLYLQSGQFTSTLKTSLSVGGVDTTPMDSTTNDVAARLGAIDITVSPSALTLAVAQPGTVVTTNRTVIISAALSLGASQPVPLLPGSPTTILVAALSLSLTTLAVVTVSDVSLTPATLLLSMTQETGVGIQHSPDLTVNIGAELPLSLADEAPLVTIFANITLEPLALCVEADLPVPTLLVGADIFVGLPALGISLATNAVTVLGDTFIFLPEVGIPPAIMSLSLQAPEVSVTDDIKIVVTNAKTFAISEYGAMAFNSMALFNGKYLYAKSDGIYEGGGDDDDGADIVAGYKTGSFDINSSEVQKLRNAFINYRSSGDIQLFSVGNEVRTRLYHITNSTVGTMHERRRKFERGIRDNHFSFGISNVDGSSFEIKTAKILTEPIRKRR